MTVVLSQTLITHDNLKRVLHNVPTALHAYVREGETLSHYIWLENNVSTALTIVHSHRYGMIYRRGQKVCAGFYDEALGLLVASCCGLCYRVVEGNLVALEEHEVEDHLARFPTVGPATQPALNNAPVPTPMAGFPKVTRPLGRLNRVDSSRPA
ncbi:MAG TPA: hypothetical protein VGO93_02510 [Candidatus Xenobia bacterium]|jgi:hypothetical protein